MLYICSKAIYTVFVLCLLVWLLFYPISSNAQPGSTAYQELREVLKKIKDAAQDENIALALELIDEAIQMLEDLEERPVLDEEALRWDRAQLNLDRADSMENLQQIALFANESVKRWFEYVEWYGNLDNRQQEILEKRPNSNRIQRAVKQLGNAIIRRINIKPYSVHALFDAYLDLPVEYLSSQSVRLWRVWLFRCPSWEENPNRSFGDLKAKFASGKDFCREDWVDFADFLDIWLKTQSLTESKKRYFERWLRELRDALDHNNTQ